MNKVINITSNGIKQAIDDLVNENEMLQDKVYKLEEKDKEIKELKNDLLYVLSQLNGYLFNGWTIDLNFTDIREKYKEDIKEYENWE